MNVIMGRAADFPASDAEDAGMAVVASNPRAVANCLAMLEGEAHALGLQIVATLIGAARLAAEDECGRADILAINAAQAQRAAPAIRA